MRTTPSLEDDLTREFKEAAHRERRPFKGGGNETKRAGGELRGKTAVKTFRSRLKAGIDQLAGLLEGNEFPAESLKPA